METTSDLPDQFKKAVSLPEDSNSSDSDNGDEGFYANLRTFIRTKYSLSKCGCCFYNVALYLNAIVPPKILFSSAFLESLQCKYEEMYQDFLCCFENCGRLHCHDHYLDFYERLKDLLEMYEIEPRHSYADDVAALYNEAYTSWKYCLLRAKKPSHTPHYRSIRSAPDFMDPIMYYHRRNLRNYMTCLNEPKKRGPA